MRNEIIRLCIIFCCSTGICNPVHAGKHKITLINFSGDNGFRHSSLPAGIKMIEDLGKKYGWKVISTSDPAIFNDKVLSSVQLVVFNNNCGNEGRIFNSSQQQALKKFIRERGAFAGIHCAGAIWHEDSSFQQWYEELVGARMVAHPAVQEAVMIVETKNHPATQHLPAYWKLTDEYHTFATNPRNNVTVLISVDENSYTGTPKMQGDHPMVWCHQMGKARSFFSALGHTEEIYSDTNYRKMIAGGLLWVLHLNGELSLQLAAQPLKKGLIVDLDADRGVFATDSGRVFKWENQAAGTKAKFFEKRDEGRKVAGSGCPAYRKNIPEINNHNALVFHEQELLNDNEDAFDHLITGSGYTFFCVMRPYLQTGRLKDVNSFFGNLRNGGMFEGIWGGFTDDNRVWAGARNGLSFGRWDANNPFICTNDGLDTSKYYLVMGRMDAGADSVALYLMVNEWNTKSHVQKIKVNPNANASRLSIGQERDAIQHPGVESFDGEIARFLLYERPLTEEEMKSAIKLLSKYYHVQRNSKPGTG